MNISQLKESRFLKKEDCGQGILVTIKSVSQENVAKEGADPELKWCVHFGETEKPLVLNPTNAQLIAQVAKSEETDHWTDVKIVLYLDPAVSYGGKIIGGIRVRAPRGKAAQPQTAPRPVTQPKATPAPVPTEDQQAEDDVPF